MFEKLAMPWSMIAEMMVRAALVYLAALVIVRIGKRRTLGHATPLDIILALILGSMFSRAINGEAPLWPTLAAAVVLVVLHGIITALARKWSWCDQLINGRPILLIIDGEVQKSNLAVAEISHADLYEALRLSGGVNDVSQVAEARLERNGQISVLTRQEAAAISKK